MATTQENAVLGLIGWVSSMIDQMKIRGAVRTAVQAWWAVLLTQTWALEALDFVNGIIGDYTLTPLQATVFTFAVLWKVGDVVQNHSMVQGNRIARAVMIMIMGGGSAPTYSG